MVDRRKKKPNHGKQAGGKKQGGKPGNRPGGRAPSITVRRLADGNGWVLVHPREAVQRAEDLEEVRLMIEGGEPEIAVEELRWLLSGCPDLMAGHVLLGELAVEMGPQLKLARGHFGHAYELGLKALRHGGGARGQQASPLPASQPANAPMHQAARGLAWCLEKLEQPHKANEVVSMVRKLDPADPMGVAALIDELRSGGMPVVGLG